MENCELITHRNRESATSIVHGLRTVGFAYENYKKPGKDSVFIASSDQHEFDVCRNMLALLSPTNQNITWIKFWEAFPEEEFFTTCGSRLDRYDTCFFEGRVSQKKSPPLNDHPFQIMLNFHEKKYNIVYKEIIDKIRNNFTVLHDKSQIAFSRILKLDWIRENLIYGMSLYIDLDKTDEIIRFVDSIDVERLKPLMGDRDIIDKGIELAEIARSTKHEKPIRLTKHLTLTTDPEFTISGHIMRDSAIGPYLQMLGKYNKVSLILQRGVLIAV